MGLFKKKADPISERSRELKAKIAQIEGRIKKLNENLDPENRPRIRSTAYPNAQTRPPMPAPPQSAEPVFEKVDQNQLKEPPEPFTTSRHFNELGARKYNLVALFERIKQHFRGPPAANPKLVNYLAAGNIQGLRPLRYERRVARNRFIALTVVFVVVLFGIFYFLVRRR
ncbi:MAG TPA: hypothetical protein VGN61_03330 [Verrucomicrobiae bacterium]|jgi:hypothetical protein